MGEISNNWWNDLLGISEYKIFVDSYCWQYYTWRQYSALILNVILFSILFMYIPIKGLIDFSPCFFLIFSVNEIYLFIKRLWHCSCLRYLCWNALINNNGFWTSQLVYGHNSNLPNFINNQLPAQETRIKLFELALHISPYHATLKSFIGSKSSNKLKLKNHQEIYTWSVMEYIANERTHLNGKVLVEY